MKTVKDIDEILNSLYLTFPVENGYLVEEAKQALNAHYYQKVLEIIGDDEKPDTWVQRHPGSVSPGTKKNTKLTESQKVRNHLKSEQRTKAKQMLGGE